MRDERDASPALVRNRLRRQVEEELLALAKTKALLGIEGDVSDLHNAVARLKEERDAFRQRVAELERITPDDPDPPTTAG